MANVEVDQAEGLRRMLAGGRQPRVIRFLSATGAADKAALLVNLAASLAGDGQRAVLLDASRGADGIASQLGVARGATTLLDVARRHCGLEQAIHPAAQGFGVVALRPRADWPDARAARALAGAFERLVRRSGIVLVDADPDADALPLPLLDGAESVIQVANSAASITTAYGMIKRLHREQGRGALGIVVTGASEAAAAVVYGNIARVASEHLALQLTSFGSVPADESLLRAARLGHAAVDAFPLAGASLALRQLAQRLAATAGSTFRMRSDPYLGV